MRSELFGAEEMVTSEDHVRKNVRGESIPTIFAVENTIIEWHRKTFQDYGSIGSRLSHCSRD